MASPSHDAIVLSSSPISVQNNSPTYRRSGSSEDFCGIASRARHPITRVRSPFDLNDSHVREHRRTMDVDLALQLSRTHREALHMSLTTPITPYDPTHPRPYPPQHSLEHNLQNLSEFPPDAEAIPEMSLEDAASGSNSSPQRHPSTDNLQRPPLEDGLSKSNLHHKLSVNNPSPRHRNGIGNKMAHFESTSGETPSGHLGFVLSDIPGVPDSSGLPSSGILNTGHDRPYRFSFYSNILSATINARSLSELPAEGQTFEQLFSGINSPNDPSSRASPGPVALGGLPPNFAEVISSVGANMNRRPFGVDTKMGQSPSDIGESNTWWLDVQNPTDEEMKVLSKVFNIHPLTTEDILMEEMREKIELFRNYYLVCFRSFDQDPYSSTYLEPINMYITVFREGILSFHFRPTPHPQNVLRRIKQLKDCISVTSDWISYALIDDITDAFGPLIQSIEYEVDSIDELVLILKGTERNDTLRRIGTCRKKVTGLLRLMGNKVDVVKGLAKRCNENWRMAPSSDIGLYLSDLQDHLITMTQNLNHYEKLLSRSHSNYLAQISLEMTDANNQINDVLSKLTALGTAVIPMNLVTGLWGMNTHVPGQDIESYAWFGSIIAGVAAITVIVGYLTYRLLKR